MKGGTPFIETRMFHLANGLYLVLPSFSSSLNEMVDVIQFYLVFRVEIEVFCFFFHCFIFGHVTQLYRVLPSFT